MVSDNNELLTMFNIKKEDTMITGSVTDLFMQETLKQPELAHLDKVFYKWFTAMH
jgi:hypothetical protein